MQNYQVVDCHADSIDNWNAFVQKNNGNYCHLYHWRDVIRNSYGLMTFYLAIVRESEWVGILPLALVPGVGGRSAVSVPYCNYGGLLVANDSDPVLVMKAALSFLTDKGIHRVEVRELCHPGDVFSSEEVTLILELPDSRDLFWKMIGDKVRNQVRKAEKAGLEVQWGREQAPDLYEVYADNMGRLGTPVHPRAFVDEILSSFGDDADVLTVRLQGRAIAAMLVLKFGDTWIDPIASSLVEFRHLNPNMILYWEALQRAMAAGMRRFDFGRSKRDSGTYKFKQQWGATEVPLNYHSYEKGVRVSSASTDLYRGNKAVMFARVWSVLPGRIQRILGPKIRRYIP
ncbi:FemAB-like protein [Candidatus Methylomirabilis limnetica]|uniref:FemAB-like protein n=1 Tax=Candidatus Methylomirabilis limnetica TaxID=2033718 RepID=A0A2T4TZY3_9BACT|nr:FemAB family XrtA/PEP-CTERM system-associated protein [Candidatus Methylomirabilis limnetica]PTL36680.1 FemAB-like protein [Candidatus Methylomirabilis limnetica]